MRQENYIDDATRAHATVEPIHIAPRPPHKKEDDNAYFAAEVVRQLSPRYGEDTLFRYGFRIYTTMDPLLQEYAQKVLRRSSLQDALVAMDPQDGKILALAGGREYKETQFNRATQAHRQPGSSFKPFVYGAALEHGFTAASILHDSTQTFQGAVINSTWSPKNYDGVYYGTTTVRVALAHSLNAATLDLANQTGLDSIVEFAKRLGIDSPLDHSLAMALGASEVTLLELTSAYAAFDNGGIRVTPYMVSSIIDAEGNVLESAFPQRMQVLEPARAYLMTSLLEEVVQNGTAKALPKMGWTRPSAGKTGTTNGGRDAWFIGYTPQLLTGVWVGDDRGRRIKLTGAKDATPLWAAFMVNATQDLPPDKFIEPQGMVTAKVDPTTGFLARTGCPTRKDEIFVSGTQPTTYCPMHLGGIRGLFHRWFGKS
jgi:membrane carboxypeptidase/penicillin-binding protein